MYFSIKVGFFQLGCISWNGFYLNVALREGGNPWTHSAIQFYLSVPLFLLLVETNSASIFTRVCKHSMQKIIICHSFTMCPWTIPDSLPASKLCQIYLTCFTVKHNECISLHFLYCRYACAFSQENCLTTKVVSWRNKIYWIVWELIKNFKLVLLCCRAHVPRIPLEQVFITW